MKKILFMFILLFAFLIVSGCNNTSVKQIKVDYINVGFGQSWYEGLNKVDKETVQSLVEAYNQIEYFGQSDQKINYEKAITLQFIYNEQISGMLVLDDMGVFHLRNSSGNYQIEPNNAIYEQTMEIYNDVKKQYEKGHV